MARLHLLLLLSLAFVISTAARSISPLSSNAAKTGPIETEGGRYRCACDRDRFAALGLNMNDFAYCNKSLSYHVRVKDLIDRMTLREKVVQLGDRAQGAHRIGLPNYVWWAEALHGVADTGHATTFTAEVPGATSFPNVIVSAASFNESLWKRLGQVVSTEARALYNLGLTGLTFWSPNINVARDPRWGRIMETPGEDPFLVGRYGVNYVRGLQDVEGSELVEDLDSRPLKVSSCCKHYAAYDLDNWFDKIVDRFTFDAKVMEQDMVETFVRPFEMCVKEADVSSLMCSFNRINGVPVCADARRLSQTFRNDWKFHGYIVSDCDSIEVIIERLKWLHDSPERAVAHVMKAGLDLDCGYGWTNYYINYTESAVGQGLVRESDIDNALKNLYLVLMRVGFFDGNPIYDSLGARNICSEEAVELAIDAARQGIVLLKNNHTLPLDKKNFDKIALIGPHANATDALIGNYAGPPCRFISPLDAIKKEVSVEYEVGCDVQCVEISKINITAAVTAAKNASATIIFAGLDLSQEREEWDRQELLLPGQQTELIKKVTEAANGPVVLVILSGGIVDVSFAENNPKIGAIIWAGYPGEEGGTAIADVIFGRYNPGGRLPLTWYKANYVDALPMTSMQLRPVQEFGYPGRTYKFFNGSVQYPFGYGLSYTRFNYTITSSPHDSIDIELRPNQHCKPLTYNNGVTAPASCASALIEDLGCTEMIEFEVEVANTGSVDGSEAVLVYSKAPEGIAGAPIKQLVAFERVFVPASGVEKVAFSINACKVLGLVETTAYYVLPSGEHTIVIGNDGEAVSFPVQINLQ